MNVPLILCLLLMTQVTPVQSWDFFRNAYHHVRNHVKPAVDKIKNLLFGNNDSGSTTTTTTIITTTKRPPTTMTTPTPTTDITDAAATYKSEIISSTQNPKPNADESCTSIRGVCMENAQCVVSGGKSKKRLCSDSSQTCCVFKKKLDKACTGSKGPCGGVCQLKTQSCGSGSGRYLEAVECGGPPNRQCCAPSGFSDEDRVTDAEARKLFYLAGIETKRSCNDRLKKHCTSFDHMRQKCITGLIGASKALPDCKFEVTGGTEVGHACSNSNGGSKTFWNGHKISVNAKKLVKCKAFVEFLKSAQVKVVNDYTWEIAGYELTRTKKDFVITC